MKNTNKKLHPIFHAVALICANVGIIIAIMHYVFHFIDSVNFAVGFLDNSFTEVIMLIVSITSVITACSIIYITYRNNRNSYFFRKIAFITIWVCFINILFQRNVIYPNLLEDYQREAIWFIVSTLTLINSVFCNGLLCMKVEEEADSKEESKNVE
jgi:hypothetical protein